MSNLNLYTYLLPLSSTAGTIFFNQGFDTNKDIVISFDYACYGYGETGSEGFSVFFTSAFTAISALTGGGPGPGLCYSPVNGVSSIGGASLSSFPGATLGAMGIGFDITGNFSTNNYGFNGFNNPVPNSISIRDNFDNNYTLLYNSGDLASNSYPFQYYLYQQLPDNTQQPTYNRIRVRVTEFGQRIIVDVKRPTDFNFTNFVNYVLPATAWWPDNVYCSLGFATGLNQTILKIKNFNVNGIFLSEYRLWNYSIDQTTLSGSYFTGFYGSSATNEYLFTGMNINIANIPQFNSTPPLINITPNGTAGLQSGDNYIIIQ